MQDMEASFKAQLRERDLKIRELGEDRKMQGAKLNVQQARLDALDDVNA